MRPSRKENLFVVLLTCISLSGFVLISSCKDSSNLTEPQTAAKLVVDNGYYTKVETTTSGDNNYSVVLQYHAEGSDFIIGDYDIQWKSENIGIRVFLNSFVINPDETFKIEETFTFPSEVLESPIITISGYALNQKGDGTTSKVSYTAQRK